MTKQPDRLYTHRRWRNLRARHLAKHPLCVMCEAGQRTTIATVVDHIVPHQGDMALFWDQTNLQSLCKPHHDVTKQSIEKGGTGKAPRATIGLDGWPT
jgi:5-methylcytosine-specific restriction enzyme A